MAAAIMSKASAAHTSGIFADMSVDGPEIGTLVVIVDRAKNLPNRKSMGKQDPYCAARLGKEAKKTNTDVRGGQTPRWDQELRFIVRDSPDYYTIKVSLFNDDKKTELIGETWIDLGEKVVVRGGGKSDNWFTLNCKGKYAGEVRLELTYYDSRPKPEGWVDKKERSEAARSNVKRRPLPAGPAGSEPSPAAPKSFGPRMLSHPTAGARQQHSLPEHMRELRARRTPQTSFPNPPEFAPENNGIPEHLPHASSRTPSDPQSRGPYPDSGMYNAPGSGYNSPYQYDTPDRQNSQPGSLSHGLPELPPMDNSRSRFAGRSSTTFDQSPAQNSYSLVAHPNPSENRTIHRERSNSRLSMQHSRAPSQSSYQETEFYSPSRQVSQQSYQPPSVQQDFDYQNEEYGYEDHFSQDLHDQYSGGYTDEPQQTQSSALYDRSNSVSYRPAELDAPPPLPPAHRSHGNISHRESYGGYEPSQQHDEYTPAPLRIGNSTVGTPQRPASRSQESSSDRWPRRRSSLFNDHHASTGAMESTQYSQDEYSGQYGSQSQQLVSPRRLSNFEVTTQQEFLNQENSYSGNNSPYSAHQNIRQYQSATDLSHSLVHRPVSRPREAQRQFFPTAHAQQNATYEPVLAQKDGSHPTYHTPPSQRRTYVPPRPKSMAHLASQNSAASTSPLRSYEPMNNGPSSPPVLGQSPGPGVHRNSVGTPQAESPYGSIDLRQSRTNERGVPMRKSISPSPTPMTGDRRTSIVPFGPDSYDELNPNSPSARASSGPNTPARSGFDPYNSQEQNKIIDFHGNAIDPSDRLPETSWAPEPEPRGQAKEKAPRNRESLTGARPSPVSSGSKALVEGNPRLPPLSVVVRGSPYSNPHTPAESPVSDGTVVRARLAKRNPMQRPQSAILPSEEQGYANIPTPPSTFYQNNGLSNGYGASPQHSPSHSHNYGSPQFSPLRPTHSNNGGQPSPGSSFAPPVPAKVPIDDHDADDRYRPGQLVKAATVGAYGDPLNHEISKIDIGGGGKGRVRRMFGR